MDLKIYASFLRRWLWLIGLSAALLGTIALIFSLQQTPLYASTTTLLVSQTGLNRNVPDFETLRTRERLAKTYAELLVKRPLLETVVANTGVSLGVGTLAERVSVTLIPETELMKLTVSDTDPTRAALLANTIAQVFPSYMEGINSSTSALSQPTLRIVEEARPSGAPVSPNIPRNIILAAVMGMLLAIGGGYLYDYFNDRIGSAARISRATGLKTVTTIGRIAGSEPADLLVVPGKTALTTAESYRMVRAALEAAERPIRKLAILSGAPQEGRSLTAANLAIAMAQTGKQVILVDADLRRPSLHRYFRASNTRGLTSALLRHGGEAAADHLVGTDIEGLRLMPAGPILANTIGHLGSPRLAALIDELEQQADLLIFDTPALLNVVDAHLIAGRCDAALLVVRANATREAALQQTVASLADSGIPVIGAVFNDAAPGHMSADYYSGVGTGESLTVIDFVRAVGDRFSDRRAGRKEK